MGNYKLVRYCFILAFIIVFSVCHLLSVPDKYSLSGYLPYISDSKTRESKSKEYVMILLNKNAIEVYIQEKVQCFEVPFIRPGTFPGSLILGFKG